MSSTSARRPGRLSQAREPGAPLASTGQSQAVARISSLKLHPVQHGSLKTAETLIDKHSREGDFDLVTALISSNFLDMKADEKRWFDEHDYEKLVEILRA